MWKLPEKLRFDFTGAIVIFANCKRVQVLLGKEPMGVIFLRSNDPGAKKVYDLRFKKAKGEALPDPHPCEVAGRGCCSGNGRS